MADVDELKSKIRRGMQSKQELREMWPGAVGRKIKWEHINRRFIDAYTRIARNKPDVAGIDELRPDYGDPLPWD